MYFYPPKLVVQTRRIWEGQRLISVQTRPWLMQMRLERPSRSSIFKVLTLNRLRSCWKDDKSILSVICVNMEDRILVPSLDLLQEKDHFILIVQDSGTSGIKVAVCF